MNKDGMAPRSVQYVKSVIRQIFHFAKARDLFHGDPPTLNFKLKKIDNKRNRFLSIEEANVLLDEIKSRSMDSYFICIMSLFCGLRFGEIAKLTWGCVDLNQRTLLIRDPKNGESRTTFISDEIYKLLSRLNPGKHADLVFPDEHGNVRKSMSDTFKRVVKHLGFNDGITDRRDHVVFHTLRHTCASWLVMNGTNLRTVQNILGHKDIAMTVRYSHLSDDYVKSQLNMLSLEEPKKTEAI